MKYALSMVPLLVVLGQQRPAQAKENGDDLVQQAVAAQRSAELKALKSLAAQGGAEL